MTEIDLDALEATARAATPGPWESWNVDDETIEVRAGSALADNGSYRSTDMIATYDVYGYELDEPDFVQTEANADHVAAFDPPTVLALIARLREAEAVIEAVADELDRLEKACVAVPSEKFFRTTLAAYKATKTEGES